MFNELMKIITPIVLSVFMLIVFISALITSAGLEIIVFSGLALFTSVAWMCYELFHKD